jgi:hypothetical protein
MGSREFARLASGTFRTGDYIYGADLGGRRGGTITSRIFVGNRRNPQEMYRVRGPRGEDYIIPVGGAIAAGIHGGSRG